MSRLPGRRAFLIAFTVLMGALSVARLLDGLPQGLRAVYLTTGDPSAIAPAARIERPSTSSLLAAWAGRPPSSFTTTWSGSFLVLRGGAYTLGTRSDDGSVVQVDGQRVVDNGGEHAARLATGSIDLEPGVHAIFIEYLQRGGPLEFELLMARQGGALEPIQAWRLSPRRAPFARVLLSALLRRVYQPALLLWLTALTIAAGRVPGRSLAGWINAVRADPIRRALAGVIGISLLLNLVGISWGVPATWAGDEMTPLSVHAALTQKFSNGWWDRYPPFHYLVLGIVSMPALWLRDLGWLRMSDRSFDGLLIIAMRLVSVAAGVGTLVAVYRCGALTFGRRAGVWASAMLAVLSLFLYYAKTANPEVPYVFWFSVSLVFYLRFLQTLSLGDIVLFSAAASAAMCTKDQAYGLYLATPLVFVHRLWEANREAGRSRPFMRALGDMRILAAAGTVATLFVLFYALPFNREGFVKHFQDITGPGSEPWRMFEPTVHGHLALFRANLELNQRAWGWPLSLVSLIGVVLALKNAATRRWAVYLLVPIVSYYAGFIDLVLYTFDRYILPMCVVEALFGGLALGRFVSAVQRPAARWRHAVAGVAFAYTFFYAAAVDVLMVRDSRYAAERWLRPRVAPGEGVGINFPDQVLPRLDGIPYARIGSLQHLQNEPPAYFILNADYARAIGPDTPLGEMVAGLQNETAGYHLAFRYRAAAPWPWLGGHADLVGPRLEPRVLSILRDINPTMEIYARDAH